MPSWIKLDMVSRLIFEPIVCYSRYWNIFVGLTPAGKSQILIGKVLRWTHTGDEGRHNSRVAKKKEGCHKTWSMIKALTPWSCILLSTTNYQESRKDCQEKSMQRSALSPLRLRSRDMRKRRSTPLDDPTKFFLIAPHAGLQSLNFTITLFLWVWVDPQCLYLRIKT
jgi:hypothetical protein